MKKINKLTSIVIGIFALALVGCGESLEPHVHSFSESWSGDATYHWHKSTCGHNVVSEKAEHTFGEWVVKTPATETTKGLKVQECTVCGYKHEEMMDYAPHSHTFSNDWTYDETNHWHASTCGHAVVDEIANHTFGEWTILIQPTDDEEGLKEKKCTICNYAIQEEIPSLTHVHTFSNDWTSNDVEHWHNSTCGHNVVSDKSAHTFGEWVVIIEPTETSNGLKQKTCTVCSYVVEETIDALPHTHTYSNDWSSNANFHWHDATCGHNVTSSKESHAFSSWIIDEDATSTTEGKKHRTCTVCGYKEEETIPRVVETLTGLIKGKTLADLFADNSGNDQAAYEITGVVYSWMGSNTNGTQYGNFRIKTNLNDDIYYSVYGSTASLDALAYDSIYNSYTFINPRDFLTNAITANIEIGDTVTMWLTRADNGTYIQAHGVIITVSKAPIIPDEGKLTVDIYATNDVHGQIEDDSNRMSIATLGTFMKTKGQEDNTLLIDQGDSWQGSIYSNHNRGALVNDVMTEAHYDARTVGNHDFDWGIEPLKANTAREYNDYTIPVLAANVYNYNFSTKTEGNVQQSDIGGKTVSYVLENGLKIGIVGIIGKDQITSITSSYVQTICFKSHIPIIKEEATKLRNEGCDIVILSAHTGQESLMDNGLEDYIDLALCGHTHSNETGNEGDLYYAQFGAYNERVGHVQLSYDVMTKKVDRTSIETFNKTQVNNQISGIDSEIASIVNTYSSQCASEANVVLANNADYFAQSSTAANLMCKAILDRCATEGYNNVVLSFSNTARKALPSGTWTYADIYTSFPFDNIVYIVNVKGSDLLNEVKKYNNCCFADSFNCMVNSNSTYQIACLDYLLYHTSSERIYDYFKTFDGTVVGELSVNYRLILREWLISNGYNNGKYLSSSNFDSGLDSFNRNRLTSI